jgi:hypothetical protein
MQQEEAWQLLRTAFADGDTFLTVNVPPRWTRSFASTRSGVLWLMHQVSSSSEASATDSLAGGGKLGASDRDVWGRSLPSQALKSGQQPHAGAFIDQDNAAMVGQRVAVRSASVGGRDVEGGEGWRLKQPQEFTISRGTILTDHAARGDVEAVFSGRAAISTCQTWPATHPFALRDEMLVHALREGQDGLPLWLCGESERL